MSEQVAKPTCGIIMPISEIDGCSSEHWVEVLSILKDGITAAEFHPAMVSDSDDVTIIQKNIVQNVYNNEIIVCDISGKNPNVMFELGLRLAFDKPTIIVKDDQTDYAFDTAVIEHLEYPRDLRFSKIIAFKDKLKKKLKATHEKAQKDPEFSTFLKSFGQYEVAQLEKKEISSDAFILESLEELKGEVRRLRRRPMDPRRKPIKKEPSEEMRSIVRTRISQFKIERAIADDAEIYSEWSDELYAFLESDEEVRDICGNTEMLRAVMIEAIVPF